MFKSLKDLESFLVDQAEKVYGKDWESFELPFFEDYIDVQNQLDSELDKRTTTTIVYFRNRGLTESFGEDRIDCIYVDLRGGFPIIVDKKTWFEIRKQTGGK